MYKRTTRKRQIMVLSIMIVAVITLSIGFAAFSSTLRISSQATVNPDATSFSVIFSKDGTSTDTTQTVNPSSTTYGEAATITNSVTPTITGLNAKFTSPGQSVSYSFYAKNTGSYLAYLNNINFMGKKVCTAGDDATDSLVQSACEGIMIDIKVGNDDPVTTNKNGIANHTLAVGNSEPVVVTITYNSNAPMSDGPFSVAFGDISLTYSTISDYIITDSGETLAEANIGAVVNYVATGTDYTGQWRILGSENGQILIVSDSVQNLDLKGKEGYNNAISLLDGIAANYAGGTKAVSARSLRVEDINKITGYNPYKTGDGKPCRYGQEGEYGNTITYSYKDGAIAYKATNGLEGSVEKYTSYTAFDGTVISAQNPNNTFSVTNSYYFYDAQTLTGDRIHTSDGTLVHDLISNYGGLDSQVWLANTCITTSPSRTSWQVRMMWGDTVNAATVYHSFDNDDQTTYTKGVRVVVTLAPDAVLTQDESGVWQIS